MTTAVLTMLRALSANRRVDADSSKASAEGEMVAMMVVRQLPPRESCSKWVRRESLQRGARGGWLQGQTGVFKGYVLGLR